MKFQFGSYPVFGFCLQPVLWRRLAQLTCQYLASNNNNYYGSTKPVECQLSMKLLCWLISCIWIFYTASTQTVLCLKLAYPSCRYFASNGNQYFARSKPVECQLSMKFQFGSYPVFGFYLQPVLYRRLAQLTWRYFISNSNQYCACSKLVECQLPMISLLQSFTSTVKEYCATTVPVVSQ